MSKHTTIERIDEINKRKNNNERRMGLKAENNFNLGIMYRREFTPESLPDFARRAEEAGFDELWVVEDCFFAGGIAAAATALACTNSITVGLGILPAVVRNPVYSAMEIALLERLYPGRFLPGLGHGVGSWMRQIGAMLKSQLTALEEITVAIRELLKGKEVTFVGRYVQIVDSKLVHPPANRPPLSLGVIGPKSLRLSGQVADGTVLSEYSGPAYVSWAGEQIAEGQGEGGEDAGQASNEESNQGSVEAGGRNQKSSREHRITVFSFACAGATTAEGREQMRPMIAEALTLGNGIQPKFKAMGIVDQVRELTKDTDKKQLEAKIPDNWIDRMAIVGTPDDWKESIHGLVDAGAHSVVLVPLPHKKPDELDLFARHIM